MNAPWGMALAPKDFGTLSGATTGARTDQTDVTLDGLDVNDMATGSGG